MIRISMTMMTMMIITIILNENAVADVPPGGRHLQALHRLRSPFTFNHDYHDDDDHDDDHDDD